MTTTTMTDTNVTGCTETISGLHEIKWFSVPAQVWVGQPERGYGEHERGFCYACDEHFVR